MSFAVLAGIGALTLWVVPVGIVGAAVVVDHDDDMGSDDRLAVLLALGMATLLVGSEVLALLGALSANSVFLAGGVIAAVAVGVMVAAPSVRSGLRPLAAHVWWMLLPLVVGAIAVTPQLLNVISHPSSFPHSTPWYYYHLAQQTVAAGGFPDVSIEWGITVPFLKDYPAFTAATAALTFATGRETLTFGAEIVRVVAAAGTGAAFFYLVRAWGGSRFAAAGSAFALMAMSIYATKTLSYRPEALSYLFVFLSVGLAKRWLDDRQPIFLVSGAAAFAILGQVHGLGWWLASIIVVATVLVHFTIERNRLRHVLIGTALLGVVFALVWGTSSLLLQGRLTDASKLDTAPEISADGTDPTWQFASFGTPSEGLPPPDAIELAERSLSRGFRMYGPGLIEAFAVGVLALVVFAGAHRGDDARRVRGVALLAILVIIGTVIVSAVFAVGWDTYVPRRTGTGRILQLTVFVLPLMAGVAASRFGRGSMRTVAVTNWFAIGAVLLALAAPRVASDGSTAIVPEAILASQRSLDLPDGLALSNAYTEGYFPAVFGVPGLLDGRAPYTEGALLERANRLLADARAYFSDPVGSALDLRGLGVKYVIVTDRSWALGTPRWFAANLDALESSPDLRQVVAADGYVVFEVDGRADG